ncbi:UvrD-helicase domain-containing protein [Deinococcus roseus]|uniref:DNA 3'-5' helicase n=1 Tax=Deinococcus roseus TaxID=392414 RepID=A0ABQ2CZH7_9DEIO|nr:ATP-dependent helicase [Deinococcus roseus]GGJ35777.1 DNA helicase [Deinococcus roseus]
MQPSPSPEQQAILEWVLHGTGHAVVQATAGSGKTTTLEMVARLLPEDISGQYCAFSKAIVEELQGRLPGHLKVNTLHSLGYQVIKTFYPQSIQHRPDSLKYRTLLTRALRDDGKVPGFFSREDTFQAIEYLFGLQRVVRMTFIPPSAAQQVRQAGQRFDLPEPDHEEVTLWCLQRLPALIQEGIRKVEGRGWVDFEDMLYVPVATGLDYRSVDFLLVDEAQDLSPLQLQFALGLIHPGGRSIFVGDDHQAIYGFAGADHHSLKHIEDTLQATVLPLSTSYRCPQLHVKLAQHFSPRMQARPAAAMGTIKHVNETFFLKAVQEGDLVLCRYNAPLASMYHELIQLGKRPRLRKGDFSDQLLRTLQQLYQHTDFNLQTIRLQADTQRVQEERRLRNARLDPKVLLKKTVELRDRLDSVVHLATTAYEQGHHTLEAARSYLQNIISVEHDFITLSTVHSAKGLEASRVFILHPEKMTPTYALTEEAVRGEQCVQFVALTRAREALYFVEEPLHETVKGVNR